MKHAPANGNGDKPATQADLALWGGQLASRIDTVEARLSARIDGLEARLDRMESVQGRMLDMLQAMDRKLDDLKHLTGDVEKLKAEVFQLKLKRG